MGNFGDNGSIEFMYSSLSKLIQINNAAIVLICKDIKVYQLFPLLNAWIEGFFKIYKNYKGLIDYFDADDNLPFFDQKTKGIICDYCKWDSYNVIFKDECLTSIGKNSDNLRAMQYRWNSYLFEIISQFITDNKLLGDDNNDSGKSEYKRIMGIFFKLYKFCICKEMKLAINKDDTILTPSDEHFNYSKVKYEARRDYSALCCGYLRNLATDIAKIPVVLWQMIKCVI